MLRWEVVLDKNMFGINLRMYRDMFVAKKTFKSIFFNLELDHQAFKHFDTELYMYRMLDTNFIRYIEERGDLTRIEVEVPSQEDTEFTVL